MFSQTSEDIVLILCFPCKYAAASVLLPNDKQLNVPYVKRQLRCVIHNVAGDLIRTSTCSCPTGT